MTATEPAEKLLSPVLSATWDEHRPWSLETYQRHDGYQGCATRWPWTRTR